MPLRAGAKLGRYEILAPVGAGGMGEVYRARDPRLRRVVALKVSRAEFSERFEREARAVAALNHPNICQVYDVGPHYLVMEYVEGEPVVSQKKPGPLPLDRVFALAIQIADALDAAHAKGVVHRDLKPANVLVAPDGRPKVLDFGLALLKTQEGPEDATRTMGLTTPGTTLGTVAFMSPEQIRGLPLDSRTDLWSFGVMLYEMVTGARPFDGATAPLTFDAILHRTPVPAHERNQKVTPDLERVIDRLLEKDRETRYQSGADVRADLKRIERDSSASSLVPSSPAAASPAAESPRKMIFAATAAVLLAGGGFFLWQRVHAAPLTDKDVLVLADFTNTTGDPVFDLTLREALSAQLEESPFLEIMPDEQVRATVRLMGRNADERITNQNAKEICLRAGEKAMISGSISSLGKSYAISLLASECQTGESLAREETEAEDKEHVLKAIARSAAAIRAKLGESLNSIQKPEALDQVTTSSLEALHAYSLGRDEVMKGSDSHAIPLLERAVELDPNFASAYLQLGYRYTALGVQERRIENYKKAFELADRVSEREKLEISGIYYQRVAGDLNRAAEFYQLLAKAYPRDFTSHNQLALIYAQAGEHEKALPEFQQSIRLQPDAENISYFNLMLAFLALDRFDEAKAVTASFFGTAQDRPRFHLALLAIAYAQGVRAAADKEIMWLAGKPEEIQSLLIQSSQAATMGRSSEAKQLRLRALELARRQGLPDVQPTWMPQVPVDAAFGTCKTGDKSTLAQAFCGDSAAAQKLIVSSVNPHATVALYLRGLNLLRARKGAEAAQQFQALVDHRGANWSPYYPAAYVQLARSAVLAGDSSRAKRAYQDFFALWKDADEDILLMLDARKEYAALQ